MDEFLWRNKLERRRPKRSEASQQSLDEDSESQYSESRQESSAGIHVKRRRSGRMSTRGPLLYDTTKHPQDAELRSLEVFEVKRRRHGEQDSRSMRGVDDDPKHDFLADLTTLSEQNKKQAAQVIKDVNRHLARSLNPLTKAVTTANHTSENTEVDDGESFFRRENNPTNYPCVMSGALVNAFTPSNLVSERQSQDPATSMPVREDIDFTSFLFEGSGNSNPHPLPHGMQSEPTSTFRIGHSLPLNSSKAKRRKESEFRIFEDVTMASTPAFARTLSAFSDDLPKENMNEGDDPLDDGEMSLGGHFEATFEPFAETMSRYDTDYTVPDSEDKTWSDDGGNNY